MPHSSIYLTDLERARPASALSRRGRPRCWRLLDYEAGRLRGTLLLAGQNTRAREVRLPLRKRGWFAIYLGVTSLTSEGRLLVRLSGEDTFSRIHAQRHPVKSGEDLSPRIQERFWQCARVDGKDLVLRQIVHPLVDGRPNSPLNPCDEACLAYVKLVRLSPAKAKALRAGRRGPNTRTLFGHHDGWSYTALFGARTPEEIRRELRPLVGTDYSRIYWEGGAGDVLFFPSRTGLSPEHDQVKDPFGVLGRTSMETWRAMRRTGVDPFRVALDYAHAHRLEFHATWRPAGFHFWPPGDESNLGGLYARHPEWRARDRRGQPMPRLSYAWPGVRKAAVGFLREMAAYPVDGVCLAYNRRLPLLDHEAPIVKGFRAEYGLDPRRLREDDPRWLRYRAGFLTLFMRELRAAMDEVARGRRNRARIGITAVVMATPRENLLNGLDLAAWVREGLVDTLVPYSSEEKESCSTNDTWTDPRAAGWFLRLTRGTPCKLALNLLPRKISPEEYRRRAHRLYRAGAEHLFTWDVNARDDYSASWTALRRLGHRAEIAAWMRAGQPSLADGFNSAQKIGGWDYRYESPG